MHTSTPPDPIATHRRPASLAARRRGEPDTSSSALARTVLHLPELHAAGGWGDGQSAGGARDQADAYSSSGPRSAQPFHGSLLVGILQALRSGAGAIYGAKQPKLLLAVLMAVALQLVVLVILLSPPAKLTPGRTPAGNETAVQSGALQSGTVLTPDNQPTPAAPPHGNTAGQADVLPQMPRLDPKDVPPWEAAAHHTGEGAANQPAALDPAGSPAYRTATLPTDTIPTEPSVARLRGTIGPPTGAQDHEQAQPGLY